MTPLSWLWEIRAAMGSTGSGAIGIAALTLVAGCSSSPSSSGAHIAPVHAPSFSLTGAAAGTDVQAVGQTDLPDGAVVELTLTRVDVEGRNDVRHFVTEDSQDVTVERHRFAALLSVNDARAQSIYGLGGPTPHPTNIVQITALFYGDGGAAGGSRQPASVVAAVGGKAGLYLKGSPAAEHYLVYHPGYFLRATKSLKVPYSP